MIIIDLGSRKAPQDMPEKCYLGALTARLQESFPKKGHFRYIRNKRRTIEGVYSVESVACKTLPQYLKLASAGKSSQCLITKI